MLRIKDFIKNKDGHFVAGSIPLSIGITLTVYLIYKLNPPKYITLIVGIVGIISSIMWGAMAQRNHKEYMSAVFKTNQLEHYNQIIEDFLKSEIYQLLSTIDIRLVKYLNDNKILYTEEDLMSLLELMVNAE